MAWLGGLVTSRTKNVCRILARKRLENWKGTWEEKIRMTFDWNIRCSYRFFLWDAMPCGVVEIDRVYRNTLCPLKP
jgi:hypothetical protein